MTASTCILRATWMSTTPPAPGQFLCSPSRRARTAYEIVEVRQNGRGAMGSYRLTLICARWPKSDIPKGATVHDWRWTPRTARRGRR